MGEPTEREWLEGLRPEDEMEFYLRPDFPSDVDVEVAAKGIADLCGCVQWGEHSESARAALLAVAVARRTEEEG